MIPIEQALEWIRRHTPTLAPAEFAVSDSLGLTLAESVESDVDSPPHDKALVDGYAVVSDDLRSGEAELAILEEVTAGAVPAKEVKPGCASRIMTGAPIPVGADAMVMIEQSESAGDSRVRLRDQPSRGQHILPRGSSLRTGEAVLQSGSEIRPVEVGVLCEVGRTTVRATPQPRVAILSTGNELVPPHVKPAAGQIRNSNGPMLAAAVEAARGVPIDLGIARDEANELAERIGAGLEADVLLLSGGVSAGVLDLVPGVLAEHGVEQVFHKIDLKPGKPLWFGVKRAEPLDRLVFGLPGNPVSSFVCFQLLVRTALDLLAGRRREGARMIRARLAREFHHRSGRTTYHPAVSSDGENGPSVDPVRWIGSADLCSLTAANALVELEAGEHTFAAGAELRVVRF